MASDEDRFKRSAAKDLRSIPARDVKRILKKIAALAMDCLVLAAKNSPDETIFA
jgi:hypothetical protein